MTAVPVPPLTDAELAAALEAIEALKGGFARNSRDWGKYRDDAWFYGIVVGWDHEPEFDGDDDGAMSELAERFGWEPKSVDHLRRLHAGWEALPRLAASLRAARSELERFRSNAEILSASTIGEAFERIEEIIRERDKAQALAATCTCGSNPETYEGPQADCPVHGAIRAFNEAVRENEQLKLFIEQLRANRDHDIDNLIGENRDLRAALARAEEAADDGRRELSAAADRGHIAALHWVADRIDPGPSKNLPPAIDHVDVRVIVFDDEFLQLFPGRADAKARMESNMRWSIICSLVSQHLSQITGLEIDFQIQSMTQANAEKGTHRIPLGVVPVLDDPLPAEPPSGAGVAGGPDSETSGEEEA